MLAASDPAQPYGAALDWPAAVGGTKHRPARKAGALAVLVDGVPGLYVERGGKSLLSFSTDPDVPAPPRTPCPGWCAKAGSASSPCSAPTASTP